MVHRGFLMVMMVNIVRLSYTCKLPKYLVKYSAEKQAYDFQLLTNSATLTFK